MEENYRHWRQNTDLKYLRAECFMPKERKVLTIKRVVQEEIISKNGDSDYKNVAYFEEPGVLPMVLNVTNCETIEKLYGTGNTYDWVGKKIQIFATKTKVAGETVPCLRIENTVPQTDKVVYLCSVCGKEISKDAYDKSVSKFGKPYCSKECYQKDKGEEDLL